MATNDQATLGSSVIKRDGFIFNGQFCVDVDGHLHKREDSATLYVLLNAVLPTNKDGKAARGSDREAHFYSAQLLHYGLPLLKTRDAAKKKLSNAFGSGRTLNVPSNILTLEAELAKEYRDLEAKLAKKEAAALNKKRKAEAAGMSAEKATEPVKKGKTKAESEAPAKPAGQAKPTAASKTSAPAAAPPPTKAPAAPKPPAALKAVAAATPVSPSKAPQAGPSKSTSKIRSKAQMERDIAVLPEDVARKLLKKLLEKVPEVKEIMAEDLTKWELSTLRAANAAAGGSNQTTPAPTLASLPNAEAAAPHAPRTKQTARKGTGGMAPREFDEVIKTERMDEDAPPRAPRTKQTARKGTGILLSSELGQRILKGEDVDMDVDSDSPPRAPRTKQTARKTTGGRAPEGWKAPKAEKVEATIGSSTSMNPGNWSGPYLVQAPELAEQWDVAEGPLTLDLYPSSTGAHIWGKFNFGIIEGIIRSRSAAPGRWNVPIPFKWRGHTGVDETQMTFGKGNEGTLTFTSQGTLTGTMRGGCCKNFTFSGHYRQVPKKDAQNAVINFKDEWRYINDHNYDLAAQDRWGGWHGAEKAEKPLESDTSGGEYRGDESSDEEYDYGY